MKELTSEERAGISCGHGSDVRVFGLQLYLSCGAQECTAEGRPAFLPPEQASVIILSPCGTLNSAYLSRRTFTFDSFLLLLFV